MFSPGKKIDKELLLEVGEMIETLVRVGALELAEEYGKHYLQLEQRIKTHDYTATDKMLEYIT